MTRLLVFFFFVSGIFTLNMENLSAQLLSGSGSDPSLGSGSATQRTDIGGLPVPLEGEEGYERQYRFGNTYLPNSMPRLNMTREEIVRQKQLDRLKMDADAKKAERQLLLEFRVKQGSLGYLLDETNRYLPQVLKKSDELPPESGDVHSPSAQRPSTPASTVPSKNPSGASVPETEENVPTEDERIEKELREHLQALEQSGNDEDTRRQKEAIEKRIEARNRWQAKRAEAERGADIFLAPPSIQLDEEALKEGWCRLFDGKTLFGWRTQQEGPYGGGQFCVANREIVSDPEHPGLLYTTNQFGDMILQLDYWAEEDAEAYLLLRSSPNPRDLNSSCYAVVLKSPDFRCPSGTVLGRSKMSVEQLRAQSTVDSKGAGWRTLRAQFDGPHLKIRLDATEAQALFEMNPLGCGYVGLLVVKGNVRFRNMLWSPGSALPLFDGISPEKNWKKLGDKLQFTATKDITMQMSNGPGIIESRVSYDNFVIQLEYNITYSSARSGIFFRSQLGVPQSGYEVSIQNFPLREDRDRFLGVDVGSFRNRKNGRYVRPEDQTWNYLTLLAVNRQFQTWVNGLPVGEMSDRRSTDAQQKDGPFLNAGTIQLMAPETGTEVQFRNLRITPIGSRHTTSKKSGDELSKTTWDSIGKEWNKNIQTTIDISNETKPPVIP